MTFNDISSPIALAETRRSSKPRDMVGPGPSDAQLERILKAAIRVPDHGKLSPWRIVIIGKDQRDAFADLLCASVGVEDSGALRQFAHQGEALLVVLSRPVEHKVPVWEQQLSAGALCMNILTATHALGFTGSWLTGTPAYSAAVRDALGEPGDTIAGFIFIGTPGRELEERPRPDYEQVVSRWSK